VLPADALRTGYPSVGSGTCLAMQGAIALSQACSGRNRDVGATFDAFI
jgi:anthraniloyl-CoA monooxygenase